MNAVVKVVGTHYFEIQKTF